jgi:hypothetical protein
MGKVPYRDFFQHHNPLLWYLFSPFIIHFSNLLHLLDVAHAIGICGGIATFFVVYKICRHFFASSLASLCSLIVLCPPSFYVFCFNFNPDTFMALFFAVGLYFLFSYWKESELKSLVLSFISFFISFLFTQKILVILAMLGGISLFVFYQKKTPIIDILYALLLPFCGLLLFVALLYSADALEVYWKSNYPFNVLMQKYYGNYKIAVADHNLLWISGALSFLSVVCFWKTSDIIFRITSILFIIELILRSFYFSISPYYMLPLMIYICCLNSKFIDKLQQKNICFIYIVLVLGVFYSYISVPKYLAARSQDRGFATYLAKNITPCDYVISSFLGNQSIMSKDPYYYWSILGHIDIAAEEMGFPPHPNLTDLTIAYRPKFIYGGIYWNNYYKNRDQAIFVQQIAPDIIQKYYNPTPFADFYLLKPEYQAKKCIYDKTRKDWVNIK